MMGKFISSYRKCTFPWVKVGHRDSVWQSPRSGEALDISLLVCRNNTYKMYNPSFMSLNMHYIALENSTNTKIKSPKTNSLDFWRMRQFQLISLQSMWSNHRLFTQYSVQGYTVCISLVSGVVNKKVKRGHINKEKCNSFSARIDLFAWWDDKVLQSKWEAKQSQRIQQTE